MPRVDVNVATPIDRTARVMQVEGQFDMPAADRGTHERSHDLPIEERADWLIGMIVGPSGSGKTQLLTELYPKRTIPVWRKRAALIDDFPIDKPIDEITGVLSSVGLSSPPAWVRPFSTLSNGEQFRAMLAWVLIAGDDVAVVDEFTSVVDRTVAKIASAAVARYVRRADRRLVVASCHYDVIDWLQPDWLYDTGTQTFEWRCLQRRPDVDVDIERSDRNIWPAFAPHHYLSAELSRSAKVFVALVDEHPAALVAALHFPHPKARHIWRDHRTVVLPDYQGIGLGNAVNERIAATFRAAGLRWRSTTAHPGMIAHRARSPLWNMDRAPGFVARTSARGRLAPSVQRRTASFEYVGPAADRGDVELLMPELADRTSVRRT